MKINDHYHPASVTKVSTILKTQRSCAHQVDLFWHTPFVQHTMKAQKILSIVKRLYFQPNVYNITTDNHVQLPRNLSQLNDYMCSPLNRKGHYAVSVLMALVPR